MLLLLFTSMFTILTVGHSMGGSAVGSEPINVTKSVQDTETDIEQWKKHIHTYRGVIYDLYSTDGDYYWRDWNSTAPYDAFVATYYNDQSVYVAQAFVGGHGLYIGYIQAGQTNITINTGLGNNAPLRYTEVVNVLCVRGSPFTWISANTDNIHTILEYNLPLVGGKVITDYNTIVYVGRYNITDASYIGSIHTDLWLYYSDGTIGKDVKEYELLVRAI